jgi:Alpha/beta hydrolase of unknown function (DUF900)
MKHSRFAIRLLSVLIALAASVTVANVADMPDAFAKANVPPPQPIFLIAGRVEGPTSHSSPSEYTYAHVKLYPTRCAISCREISSAITGPDGRFLMVGPATDISNLHLGVHIVVKSNSSSLKSLDAPVKFDPDMVARVDIDSSRTVVSIASVQFNRYAKSAAYFYTDRAVIGGDFANKADPDGAVHTGTLEMHVDRQFCGNDAAGCNDTSCPFSVTSQWTCEQAETREDDTFVSDIHQNLPGVDPVVSLGSSLDAALARGLVNTVLVYVHGFNTSFDGAVAFASKASIEAVDRPHLTVIYSWPSKADGAAYADDYQQAELSAITNFAHFMNMLTSLTNHPSIILIGHSMGTHVITDGLVAWARSRASNPVPSNAIEQILFFSSDEGAADWQEKSTSGESRSTTVLGMTKSLVDFQSGEDAALISSNCLMHDGARLGQPNSLPVESGETKLTIRDVSDIAGWGSAGHDYHVQSLAVAEQFDKLLAGQNAITKLDFPWLGPNDPGGVPYQQVGAKDILCPLVGLIFSH